METHKTKVAHGLCRDFGLGRGEGSTGASTAQKHEGIGAIHMTCIKYQYSTVFSIITLSYVYPNLDYLSVIFIENLTRSTQIGVH